MKYRFAPRNSQSNLNTSRGSAMRGGIAGLSGQWSFSTHEPFPVHEYRHSCWGVEGLTSPPGRRYNSGMIRGEIYRMERPFTAQEKKQILIKYRKPWGFIAPSYPGPLSRQGFPARKSETALTTNRSGFSVVVR